MYLCQRFLCFRNYIKANLVHNFTIFLTGLLEWGLDWAIRLKLEPCDRRWPKKKSTNRFQAPFISHGCYGHFWSEICTLWWKQAILHSNSRVQNKRFDPRIHIIHTLGLFLMAPLVQKDNCSNKTYAKIRELKLWLSNILTHAIAPLMEKHKLPYLAFVTNYFYYVDAVLFKNSICQRLLMPESGEKTKCYL